MKRIPFYLTVCFTAGLIIGIYIKYERYIVFFAIFLFIISILLYLRGRKTFCLIYLLIFVIGISVSSYKLYKIKYFVDKFNEKDITVNGQISGSIQTEGNMTTYSLLVDSITEDGTWRKYNCKINIVDYRNKKGYIIPYNYVSLNGNFTGIHGFRNTGMPDSQLSMFEKGIYGVLTADYCPDIKSERCGKRFFLQIIYNINHGIKETLNTYLNKDVSEMMAGVLLGDTSGIPEDDYDNFKKCGILHIFAVSGSNIYLLYHILNIVLAMFNKKKRTLIILILLFIYTMMTGASASIMRAYVMAVILAAGRILNREADPLNSLCIAALVLQILNPLSIIDIGFQLSFAAVLSIIILYPKIRKIRLPFYGIIRETFDATLSVQIGILPLTIYYFNSFALLSLVSNMFIVPLTVIFTTLGVILIAAHYSLYILAPLIAAITNITGSIIIKITAFISSIPYVSINALSPKIVEIILYYILISYLFNIADTRNKYKRQVFIIVSVLSLSIIIWGFIPPKLIVSFIDVGEGDCILIRTPDKKNILIDGGGRPELNKDAFDIGENVVKPYLLKHNVNHIDMIISTHSDDDHFKGLVTVMKVYDIDNFIKSSICDQKKYNELIQEGLLEKNKATNVSDGDVIDAGSVKFYVLNPYLSSENENDSSVVVLLEYQDFHMLLTGDISDSVEERLLGRNIGADILKVPHHGSSTSLDVNFLSNVNPKSAVISVGRNSYGHPSDEVLKKLEDMNIRIYRTDKDGEIIIKTDGRKYSIRTAV